MAAITVAIRTSVDGTLTIPKESVEKLGLRPGDEAKLSVETRSGSQQPAEYDEILDRLFEEVDSLVPEPGTPPSNQLKAAWGAGVEEKFSLNCRFDWR